MSQHGGYTNAYTSLEDTNYEFQVTHDQLRPALDRFAQFFVEPLFTESATAREMNAVNEGARGGRCEAVFLACVMCVLTLRRGVDVRQRTRRTRWWTRGGSTSCSSWPRRRPTRFTGSARATWRRSTNRVCATPCLRSIANTTPRIGCVWPCLVAVR